MNFSSGFFQEGVLGTQRPEKGRTPKFQRKWPSASNYQVPKTHHFSKHGLVKETGEDPTKGGFFKGICRF